MSTPSKWKHFSKEELACHCGCGHGEDMMDGTFMRTMVLLREQAGFPFVVTSAYRCPEYNAKVSHTGRTGPHTTGRAMDIAISRRQADTLDKLSVASQGITGRGWQQRGEKRFIHLDDLPDAPGQPRPTIWSY